MLSSALSEQLIFSSEWETPCSVQFWADGVYIGGGFILPVLIVIVVVLLLRG